MSNTVRILSFDPGIVHAGWAVGDFDLDQKELYILDYGVMEPSKGLGKAALRDFIDDGNKRIMSLIWTREMVSDLYSTYRPNYVCSEDAFFNRFRPTAYAALLQWITAISLFLWDAYQIELYKFAPKLIKHAVSRGDSGKLDVQAAIRNIPQIHFDEEKTGPLKEHSADAIACNWTFCTRILPSKEKTDVSTPS